MAFLSKLKDIFYDKVEVDPEEEIEEELEPVKPSREVREEKPRVEEIKQFEEKKEEVVKPKIEDTFSERDLFRNDKPFTFTELEEDEDLPPRKSVLDLDRREVKTSSRVLDYIPQERVPERTVERTPETPRVFKPTPIISPIYGILDKDYKKEEIREKSTSTNKSVVANATTTYDSVRRKAYGTLEDDLEDTLNSMNKVSTRDVEDKLMDTDDLKDSSKTIAELNEKTQKIENLINQIEEATDEIDRTMSIGELEDTAKLDNFETEQVDNNETVGTLDDKTMTDSTLEHDLFNLIDSMYDDKED